MISFITRIISKTYFQIKFISCVSKRAYTYKFTDISRRSDACNVTLNVSSIKVNLDAIVSRSCFEPML